ncbi:DUF371 domain-containing protein [Candidatus Woesearchaeota archaeon]|nr:DUF371 domain-containing protein [Candidatus Woesearchaeota archaeon]
MRYEFSAHGHKNIRATHSTTLEFTKDPELTEKGDCIVGVRSDFEHNKLKMFLQCKKIRIILAAPGKKEELTAVPNPHFDCDNEIVIRKSGFISKRTFATSANIAASDIDRELISCLKNNTCLKITVECI